MRIILIMLFCCILISGSSQEIRVAMDYGFAIGELNLEKKIMLHTGARVGAEFHIGERSCLSFAAGGFVLRYNYYGPVGEAIFRRKFFLSIPVTLKRYYPLSNRSSGFVEAGLGAFVNISDRKETTGNGILLISRKANPGWNVGAIFGLGFKTMINNRLSFDIGLVGQKDFLDNYKGDQYRIRTEKTSLSFSFYRKI